MIDAPSRIDFRRRYEIVPDRFRLEAGASKSVRFIYAKALRGAWAPWCSLLCERCTLARMEGAHSRSNPQSLRVRTCVPNWNHQFPVNRADKFIGDTTLVSTPDNSNCHLGRLPFGSPGLAGPEPRQRAPAFRSN